MHESYLNHLLIQKRTDDNYFWINKIYHYTIALLSSNILNIVIKDIVLLSLMLVRYSIYRSIAILAKVRYRDT
jgi:hypothetical protein